MWTNAACFADGEETELSGEYHQSPVDVSGQKGVSSSDEVSSQKESTPSASSSASASTSTSANSSPLLTRRRKVVTERKLGQ